MSNRQDARARQGSTSTPSLAASRLGGSFIFLCSLALFGCRKTNAALADAPPPPVLDHSVRSGSERANDDLWQRASQGDPLDLARLADRQGASGLLEGLQEGGVVGLTALLALPHADDADVAYRRLGEIIRQLGPDKAAPVIEAALGMMRRPRRQAEILDAPGMKYCAEALLEVANQKRAPTEARANAISALRALAHDGLFDPAAIPSDLDPE